MGTAQEQNTNWMAEFYPKERIPHTSVAKYVGRDVHLEWVGPLPTDPLELVLEYKLGFDDVSDLADKTCIITYDKRKQLTVDDAKTLAQAFIDQGPCKAEYLFLQGNEFGDEGLMAIAEAIKDGALPKLLTVDFSRNGCTDKGFIAFVNVIKHCRQFRDIIFSENTLGDEGFAALHEVFKRDEWPNVERINLAGAQFARHTISDASFLPWATDLADGKIKMLRLEEFEMSDNDIKDAGYAAFAVAIQRGNLRKLKSLYFVSNLITDEGAGALAAAIANNKRCKLFDIRLGFQSIDEPMAARVTKAGGKAAIEAAGETLGRKVSCILAPLDSVED